MVLPWSHLPHAEWRILVRVKDSEIVFLIDLIFKHRFLLSSFPPKNSIFQNTIVVLKLLPQGLKKIIILKQLWVAYMK